MKCNRSSNLGFINFSAEINLANVDSIELVHGEIVELFSKGIVHLLVNIIV